ncbi:MAG TPA: cyclophilin [Alcanivorax sp.]|jgi:cyclophilin family peptidyl-prolyl cis-trans isomerase|nr:cyclophilin [Alcanivorax sp.]HAD46557.1 cyclophilin [Alcanivorax sp.]HAI90677.1 cyclophilin [Alcanivorax sp.]HBP70363.1 cyclophilin [Alcanivorax sp.]HBP93933.1 cyclophilin [Alcanivorax sp.]|tara:strand:- start:2246 stop:2845 length:600 start_codon:yes stop_codon:yes gene_type:complete
MRWLLPLLALLPALALAEGPRVTLSTTQGDIVIELNQEQAPATAANFLEYVDAGFYDGTVFHRVIRGFMIQGGGFALDPVQQDLEKKETRAPIRNEAGNGLENRRGTIAMARTGNPHSATAQFFINLVDNRSLNHTGKTPRGWGYTVFGEVVEGMDTVDRIAGVATGTQRLGGQPARDVPKDPVVIENARRVDSPQASQ